MKRLHSIYWAVVILAAAMIGCGGGSNSPTVSSVVSTPPSMNSGSTTTASTPAAITFALTGNMTTARVGHTATLLPDGRVLIAGGDAPALLGSVPSGRTAELYDPATGTFLATGSMNQVHSFQTATLLNNGKVLIAGGGDAEIYDPATGSFSPTGGMLAQNKYAQATLLAGGEVLVAGEVDAELYDPATAAFHQAGPYVSGHIYTSATLLTDGRVLLEGDDPAQIYDPATDTFSRAASLASAGLPGLDLFSATLLKNGKVLIAGGEDGSFRYASAELYDPGTGNFSATGSMSSIRDAHAAVLLLDGRALVVGGDSMSCGGNVCQFSGSLAAAELYDPSTGSFTSAGDMNAARSLPKVTLLKNGDVLVTGGNSYCGIGCFKGNLASAELYHPR